MGTTDKIKSSGKGQQVLVVDDNEAMAGALTRLLKQAGYATETFHRGADAIEFAQHNSHTAAAVVDIHLPDMNGLLVTQKLRAYLGPQAPILILSGDTSMTTLNSLPHVGATYFFSKPVNATSLLQGLEKWITTDRGDSDADSEHNATGSDE